MTRLEKLAVDCQELSTALEPFVPKTSGWSLPKDGIIEDVMRLYTPRTSWTLGSALPMAGSGYSSYSGLVFSSGGSGTGTVAGTTGNQAQAVFKKHTGKR